MAAGQDDNFPRRLSTFPVQLLDEEGDKYGHTISEHVSKSADYLMRRLQAEQPIRAVIGIIYADAIGSFTSLRAANSLVSATLSEPGNVDAVAAVASGQVREFGIIESTAPYSSPTGNEAFRISPTAQPYMRATNAVRVIIVHDPTLTRGYRVHTAFPITKKF